MIDISLTLEQKTALEARHTKAPDKRECDRIKAVLLRSEGWPIAKIAQALRKSDASITLHYLPPYSSNLNPIERLWKVMNEYARNNRYFSTAKEFRHHI